MNKTNFLNALKLVKPGTINKTSRDLSYFYFSGKEVISYNDKICIRYPLETPFSTFMKADDLLKVLLKSNSDEVRFRVTDKIEVKVGGTHGKFSLINEPELLSLIDNVTEQINGLTYISIPNSFKECVSVCVPFASKDESSGTLTCVRVNGKDVFSCDNYRVSHATMDSEIKPMFLKASEVHNIIAIDPIYYAGSKSWIHFINKDKCIISIRKVSGEFPDILPLFNFEGTEVEVSKEVINGIDVSSIFTSKDESCIEIDIKDGKFITSITSEKGTMSHSSNINYKGNELNFKVQQSFLQEMLNYNSVITIGSTKIKLKKDNFQLAVCLYS